MAGNSTSSVLGKRKYNSDEDWNNFKEEIFRIYILEHNTLEETMAKIERINGPLAKKRRWKEKLKEWDFMKNKSTHDWQWMCATRMEYFQKCIGTVFYYQRTKITTEMFDEFEKRRTETVALDVEKPPNVTYYTLIPRESDSFSRKICEELDSFPSILSATSVTSLDYARHAYSLCSFNPETEENHSASIDPTSAPFIMNVNNIHKWQHDNHRPWSLDLLSHLPIDYEKAMSGRYKVISDIISNFEKTISPPLSQDGCAIESLPVPVDNDYSPYLCGIGAHIDLSQKEDDDTLSNLFSLEANLAGCQAKHGELDPSTLKQHFEIAKALERNGQYQEAEYHCRRIINRHSQTAVETFLGLILAKCQRFQESMSLLIRALTSFIIHFDANYLDGNVIVFSQIELLCTELVLLGDGDHRGWSLCLCQLMATLSEINSEHAISRIRPQLFIHGFSFAYEFSLAGFFKPAGWMYEDLLYNCLGVLDIVHHALVKASAHQRYGVLLKKQGHWRSSAKQLLRACKSAKYSETFDRDLCRAMEKDYVQLTPHLKNHIAEELREALDRIRPFFFISTSVRTELGGSFGIDEWLTKDSPMDFTRYQRSALDQLDQFAAPPRATVSTQEIIELTALTSSVSLSGSGSHNNGMQTWPGSDWDEYAGIISICDGLSKT